VPSASFCTSTPAGGTGRVQPGLVRKTRDRPVSGSSDTLAKLANIVLNAAPHPLSTNLAEVARVRTRPG